MNERIKICAISDTHNRHELLNNSIKNGGPFHLLIHCGDATNRGTNQEIKKFNDWILSLKEKRFIRECIFVPGNHDIGFDVRPDECIKICNSIDYILINSAVEVKGLKIYGTPNVPTFGDWAFMKDERALENIYSSIPQDLDILISHGPPHGILDRNAEYKNCGSISLLEAINSKKPKNVLCGHIHEDRGLKQLEHFNVYNISCISPDYKYMRDPVDIEL